MKYCTKCGAPQNDSAKFCNKCGASFADTESNVKNDAPATDNSRIESSIEKNPKRPKVKSKDNTTLILTIMVVVILFGIVGYVIFSSKDSSKLSEVESETSIEKTATVETEVYIETVTTVEEESPDESVRKEEVNNKLEVEEIPQNDAVQNTAYSGKPAVKIEMSEYKQSMGDEDYVHGYTSSFIGVDKDGEKAWEIETGFIPDTDIGSPIRIIGINDGYGYIYLNGITKINLNDGSVIWELPGYGDGVTAFDDDGTLFGASWAGEQLYKIDQDGNVTEKHASDYYIWPTEIELQGDRILITFDEPYNRTLEFSKSDLSLLTTVKNRVFDAANLLSEKERSDLNWFLDDNSNYLGMDLIVDTTYYKYGETYQEYLQNMHDYDMEVGEIAQDCIMLLIDTEENQVCSNTYGSARDKYSKQDIANAQDEFCNSIKYGGDYENAIRVFFSMLGATTGF